jgi:hypothetical protein
MSHAYAIVTAVDDGYSVQTGPMVKSPKTYETFDAAYQNAAQHVGWDYKWVSVRLHPKEIQEIMDKVQARRDRIEQRAIDFDNKKLIEKLKKEYPDEWKGTAS